MQMTTLAIGMGGNDHVSVRREPTREFQTGEVRELNIEGVICRKFIRVKTLNFDFSLVSTLGVPGYLRNGVVDELHRCSIRRRADNTVGSGAYNVVTHILIRTVNGVHRCSANTFRSLDFYD